MSNASVSSLLLFDGVGNDSGAGGVVAIEGGDWRERGRNQTVMPRK